MSAFDPSAYGRTIGDILRDQQLNVLGPGTPNPAARETLNALNVENAFAGRKVHDQDMARACLAGLWLYHNYLDESHEISQDIQTSTGSYWHGLMHRQEPDFENAKYWFRKVGIHPVFEWVQAAAKEIAGEGAHESCGHSRRRHGHSRRRGEATGKRDWD